MSNNNTKSNLRKKESLRLKGYWKNRLAGFEPNTYFDYYSYTSANKDKVAVYTLEIPYESAEDLRKIARSEQAMHLVLLTVTSLLASKYATNDDVGIIAHTLNQEAKGVGNKKWIPFRINDFSNENLISVLGRLSKLWLEDCRYALENEIPGYSDLKEFSPVAFCYNDKKLAENLVSQGVEVVFHFTTGKNLSLCIFQESNKFPQKYIEQLGNHFLGLLDHLLKNRKKSISEIVLTDSKEKSWLDELNATDRPFSSDKTVIDFFVKNALEKPDQLALQFEGDQLTYKELHKKSNQVAHYLRSKFPGKGNVYGVYTERSLEMMIAIFGILKSGGVYLPLSKNYPVERTLYTLENSEAKAVFDTEALPEELNAYCKIQVEEAFNQTEEAINVAKPEDLAYIIYTSGSTGKPKGVLIKHRSLVNRLEWMQNSYQLGLNDRIIQKTPTVFDVSVWELFWWSMYGASLVLAKPGAEKDPEALCRVLDANAITTMHFVPSMLNAFLAYLTKQQKRHSLKNLRQVFTSGEELKTAEAKLFLELFPDARLHNLYGPTEATIDVSYHEVIRGKNYRSIPIGKPIDNTQLYVLNDKMQLLPPAVTGELYIGGVNLSEGYLKLEKLTTEKFIENPFKKGEKLYKTGDLARWDFDGELEFLGRIDNQVKIRGNRIELGEIENHLMKEEGIEKAVVLTAKHAEEDILIGYLVTQNKINEDTLRSALLRHLPEYMVPNFFVCIPEIPVTVNGKVDRKALPPVTFENELPKETPGNKLEEKLIELWAELLQLSPDLIGVNSNFYKLGGSSLKMMLLSALLEDKLSVKISVTELFKYTTVKALAQAINTIKNGATINTGDTEKATESVNYKKVENHSYDIAVIGMDGRFPGAENIEQFWKLLVDEECAIQFFNDDELLAEGESPEHIHDPSYVKANAYVKRKEDFDADFFGYRPGEASLMDPQLRVFHEVCWRALEDAGYTITRGNARIGLFAGAASNLNWQTYATLANEDQKVDDYTASQLRDVNFLCSRISYALNLMGPAFYLNTACSTSLVAVQRACQSILMGECDMALAGGITLNTYSKRGYFYKEGMINAPDGLCRPFDKDARGTVGGEGAGIVVLKKLDRAIADRDAIYAVIKGAAVNNDGNNKMAYTAPSIEGQAKVIKNALAVSGVKPNTVRFLEAHGTATKLGDPIEINALNSAYGSSDKPVCAVGSVKSNIGHLDIAAGVAGFIKTCLSLKNRKFPASLNFNEANPELDLENSLFFINKNLKDYSKEKEVLRAAVSSFGIGGTNAHIILEEAPRPQKSSLGRSHKLVTFSAHTETALKRNITNFKNFIEESDENSLADIAFTQNTGRSPLKFRKSIVAKDKKGLLEELNIAMSGFTCTAVSDKNSPECIFMFSGQGSQYLKMGKGLYENENVFRDELNRCFDILKDQTGTDFHSMLFENEVSILIENTENAQPLLFAVEYAMAHLLISLGIFPDKLIGHSIGEYTAACIAGIFSLEDALYLVSQRGKIMQTAPKGTMLSVACAAEKVKKLSDNTSQIDLAAINSSALCTVAGEESEIKKFESVLTEENIKFRRLKTSHAFHSRLMEPVIPEFEKVFNKIEFNEAQIPVISNRTGEVLTEEAYTSPSYWSSHLRDTVNFSEGIGLLLQSKNTNFVEIGPGNALSTFVLNHNKTTAHHSVVSTMRHPKKEMDDNRFLIKSLGKLWEKGIAISWEAFYSAEKRNKMHLPTYSFDAQKFPVHVNAKKLIKELYGTAGTGKRSVVEDWFYVPGWDINMNLKPFDKELISKKTALVFNLDNNLEDAVKQTLEKNYGSIIYIHPGSHYQKISTHSFSICLNDPSTVKSLFNELNKGENTYDDTFFKASLVNGKSELQQQQVKTLIEVVNQISSSVKSTSKSFKVITTNAQYFYGAETGNANGNVLSGFLKVAGQEFPGITFGTIDLDDKGTYKIIEPYLLEALVNKEKGKEIVFRNGLRWERAFKRLTVEEKQDTIIEKGAHYLISGGLGNLGYTIATYLLEKYKVKLTLTGRTNITKGNESASVTSKFARLDTLQKKGDVRYVKVDMCNTSQLEEAVLKSEKAFGKIKGVIHAAGVVSGDSRNKALTELQPEDFEVQMRAKVGGLKSLLQIFESRPVDFCITTSTIANFLGGLGYGAYVSANALADFITLENAVKGKWITVNLDGLNFEKSSGQEIAKEELPKVFEVLLNHTDYPQVLVSTSNLDTRIDSWVRFKQQKTNPLQHKTGTEAEEEERFEVSEELGLTDTEKMLLYAWRQFFGKKELMANDDFFEIGGDSLKALTLVTLLQNELPVQIGIKDIFKYPTVKKLAEYVEGAQKNNTSETVSENVEEFTF